jgi:hypothetical protein
MSNRSFFDYFPASELGGQFAEGFVEGLSGNECLGWIEF